MIYGRYPNDLQWRINLGFGIGLFWLMPLVLKKLKNCTLGPIWLRNIPESKAVEQSMALLAFL